MYRLSTGTACNRERPLCFEIDDIYRECLLGGNPPAYIVFTKVIINYINYQVFRENDLYYLLSSTLP
jgi:hypothetical protein